MPANLLTPLNSAEMLDLLAYLLLRGSARPALQPMMASYAGRTKRLKLSAACLALFVAASVLAVRLQADDSTLIEMAEIARSVTVDPHAEKPADPTGGSRRRLREAFHLLPGFRVK